jgi:hypothetical protein
MHQSGPELAFELGYMFAGHGRREIQAFSGSGKAAGLDDIAKDAQAHQTIHAWLLTVLWVELIS